MADGAWRNWAGNQTAAPHHVLTPRSADEVAAAVRFAVDQGLAVRMAGSGHSFTPAAVTDGVLLLPGGLTRIRSVDAGAGLVTVEAGCPLRVLNETLLSHGLALANLGDIQEQTVAGAIQTGTHGTGRDTGGIAAQVAGLELVLADGTVVTCSADERPALLSAAAVGLGALGILTAVTFRVVPAFLLEAREQPMHWDEVTRRLDELTTENEHFEFYWFPHTGNCLAKRNNTSPGPARPLAPARKWLDDEFLSNTVFGLANQLGHRVPAAIRPVNRLAAQALGSRTYVDASHRVYTSPRRVRFKEQEYAVGREQLPAALAGLRELFRTRDWRISFPIEVRVSPADDLWLSTAHGRSSGYIACHVFHASPHEPYFRDVEAMLTELGGRPHWGKLHTRDAAYLSAVYPKFADFAALRDKLDPGRRFANAYTRQVLGD
ncbi:MAG TPA: D-arabinono-1,4-lactone oxidase [Streptosporangiaceae bacterium]|jgi:FAD-linked oxidoreductase